MALRLRSASFSSGDWIPMRHTCEGANTSPALQWNGLPEGTKSLALIFDAPDADVRPWAHWILYNISPDRTEIAEDFGSRESSQWPGAQGRNDFGSTFYEGPCPPPGATYDYYFRLYALDDEIDLPDGATRAQLLDRIRGHIIEQTELLGRYATDEEQEAATLRYAGGEMEP